jgi:hypothetical protein
MRPVSARGTGPEERILAPSARMERADVRMGGFRKEGGRGESERACERKCRRIRELQFDTSAWGKSGGRQAGQSGYCEWRVEWRSAIAFTIICGGGVEWYGRCCPGVAGIGL